VLISKFKVFAPSVLIALVGVQSNQFPRAVDLARPFREKSIPVCIGGFHVSGCLSMLPEMPDDLKEAQALGISLFAGEAEDGRLDIVLKDAFEGALKPLYNFMSDLPDMANQPMPILPRSQVRRTAEIWAANPPSSTGRRRTSPLT
jgi:hypothetical protein